MQVNQYIVSMQHDDGVIRIQTAATSKEAAAVIVCKAEHAPRRSVISIKRIRA